MKRNLWHIILVASVVYGLSSCSSSSEEPIPVLTLKTSTFTYGSGNQFMNVAAEGSWTLSVQYLDGTTGWVSFDQNSGKGMVDVILSYTENESENSRSARIVLSTHSHEVSQTITQGGKVVSKVALWLELPALKEGSNRMGFFSHAMDGGKYVNRAQNGVRNWSFYWNYNEHLSHWVAYPLNPSLIGKGNRTDQWGYDPLIPAKEQPNLINGSYGGGWTRGHQIPSADRLNEASNISTFYATNMTPQEYNFNGGIWARLESQVRNYSSKSDTLYVVTGCILKDSKTTTGNSSGFSITVPSAYYKALLRKKGSDYSAVGFYLPHDSGIAYGNFMDYILSIDELEEKTGEDFFPNLVAFIGADKASAIESADPASVVKNW